MAKIKGFKSEAPAKGFPMLPKGAYVAGIKNVKIEGDAPDQRIVFRVDIIEGEQAGYFTKRYNHDKDAGGNYEAKYKGDYKIQIPDGNNEKRQHPEWDLKKLNNTVWAIEQSNPGFKWDGDTDHVGQFKGKMVGINMQYGTFNGIGFTAFQLKDQVFGVRQEDEDDPMSIVFDVVTDPEKTAKLGTLIRILGNAGLEEKGEAADLTDKWILRNMKPVYIMAYAMAAMAVINDGNKVETPAEDRKGLVDEGLEEEQAKKQPGN